MRMQTERHRFGGPPLRIPHVDGEGWSESATVRWRSVRGSRSLECGGKRSATPLCLAEDNERSEAASAAGGSHGPGGAEPRLPLHKGRAAAAVPIGRLACPGCPGSSVRSRASNSKRADQLGHGDAPGLSQAVEHGDQAGSDGGRVHADLRGWAGPRQRIGVLEVITGLGHVLRVAKCPPEIRVPADRTHDAPYGRGILVVVHSNVVVHV